MRFGSKLESAKSGGGRSLYLLAISSVLSVSFDSLVPTRLTLRANLRLLYLKGPAFSIVVNSAEFGFNQFSDGIWWLFLHQSVRFF